MNVGTPTKIRRHTRLYCKKFFQTGKKSLKRRNLWELPHFQVLNLK
ncbi:hypothetical protein LEP1GSC039_1429 [Leptospira santarosai str. 2000027870]|nr:hypothetical protein LEP1GSC039_1429 [Leptospira santarosai str. 2000027870]